METRTFFELYLHEKQSNGEGIKGFDLEKHLEKTRMIDRCFSLEDEVIKGWFANPDTYPEEFKDKAIFLWRSRWISEDKDDVVCLIWIRDSGLVKSWKWLEEIWRDHSAPTLLKSFY